LGKVISQGELILQRREWKRNGKRVVFTSGVFDLLHPGHIRLLEQARAQGDLLVVAIHSFASVRRSESSGGRKTSGTHEIARPITPAAERAEILAALEAVDFVTEFDDATPHAQVMALAPDIHVKAGVASKDSIAKREGAEAAAAGVKMVYIPLEPGFSTTRLLERIQHLHA
jgi:D-glycero-beta-D-manno-heptose 1-phosphate adenylyltransferase